MLRIMLGISTAALLLVASGMAQDLSNIILPSVDEVYEAMIQGEITYDQYVILLELIQSGITPQNRFLLDEIPNLADFSLSPNSSVTALETEQLGPFWRAPGRTSLHRRFSYQYYTTLAEAARDRYHTSMNYDFDRHWTSNIQATKELSGRERFTTRAIGYASDSGSIRSVQIGSFQTRYGLGSVIGYRGKILHYHGRLDDESFLFPDNGGFNGLDLSLQAGTIRLGALISVNRDTAFHLVTAAQMVEHNSPGWKQSFILGVSRITDRSSEKNVTDLTLAADISRTYPQGTSTIEYCVQAEPKPEFGTILLEGVHHTEQLDLRYAAWRYGSGFLDLTAGSKAASISHSSILPEVELEYSDKRTGQFGILTKTISSVSATLKFTTELLAAARDSDSMLVQIRPGMEWSWDRNWTWTLDYLHTYKSRFVDSLRAEPVDRRVRLESQYRTSGTALRASVAHTSSAGRGDYLSLFVSAKHATKSGSTFEAWSNLGRLTDGTINYWYGYVRTIQPVADQLDLSAKLSHRCDFSNSQPHETAVSLELIADL